MKTLLPALTLLVLPAASNAQTAAPASRSGGLGALLGGGGLPSIGSASLGNAAGLLGYCLKNNLLSGAGAQSVLGTLSGKPGVATSPDYAAGQAGRLTAGQSTLPLGNLKGQLKTRLCSMVLSRAKAFM